MRNKGWIIVVCSAIFIALFEGTFLCFLPSPWNEWHPLLEGVVLLTILDKPRHVLLFAGLAGFFLSMYHFGTPVFFSIQYLWIAAILLMLQEIIVTNRSLYAALSLMCTARVLDALCTRIPYVFNGFFSQQLSVVHFSWVSLFKTFLWDIGTVSAVFIIVALFTRHFMMTVSHTHDFYDNA